MNISLLWMGSGITDQMRCVYQLWILWADHGSTHCAASIDYTACMHVWYMMRCGCDYFAVEYTILYLGDHNIIMGDR